MKLLYITPKINGEGGIEKVLSVKTNYLIENFDYQIDILTQNKGNEDLFFDFNKKIGLYDVQFSNNKIKKLIQYRNRIQKQIKISNPDVIIICDAGIKAFLIPKIVFSNKKIIFEIHGSKYNESQFFKPTEINLFFRQIKYLYKGLCIKFFDKVVFLSNESLSEWNIKNGIIIPNPLDKYSIIASSLNSKKIIVVARHSFEKGIDKLLKIWQAVSIKQPDWILEIYGKEDVALGYKKYANELNISKSVHFFEPVKNISEKYLNASIYLMTSRQEGLPMVLIEAQNCGLPCIAYDCPVGPRTIISNNENGFLIENDNENDSVAAVCLLIEDENLRIEMGKNAKISAEKYQIEPIMQQWNELFISLIHIENQF